MSWLRLRWRLRSLLVLVSLAALLAWAASLPGRSRHYRLRAADHLAHHDALQPELRYARMMLDDLAWYQPALASDLAHWQEIERATSQRIAHHLRWRAIFQDASQRPWISIPPETTSTP